MRVTSVRFRQGNGRDLKIVASNGSACAFEAGAKFAVVARGDVVEGEQLEWRPELLESIQLEVDAFTVAGPKQELSLYDAAETQVTGRVAQVCFPELAIFLRQQCYADVGAEEPAHSASTSSGGSSSSGKLPAPLPRTFS